MHPFLKELMNSNLVFVDTETTETGSMWSIQISTRPGSGAFILHTQTHLINFIANQLSRTDMLTVAHNAPFDLPVLKSVGIIPSKVIDTMELAYLLQCEPQGLKPLAFRHAGMVMQSFTDITAPTTRLKSLHYLATAVEHEWPDPEPVLEFRKDGDMHVRQPQNISKKIAGILRDATTKPVDKTLRRVANEEDDTADPFERWNKIEPEDGRAMVEEKLGKLHQAYLQDIPFDEAVHYSVRDPDATARVYHSLMPKIKALGLEKALEVDMAAMPICLDMMECGILVDVPYLQSLSSFFESKLHSIRTEITKLSGGKEINPGSYQQVSDLLFKHLKIRTIKKFSKEGYHPTGDEVLAQLVADHPVVQKIRNYKEYAKYRSTYTEKIPNWVDSDGRVHPTIRTTRVSTGRWSMKDPNLQQVPVRKEDARKIRQGFVAQKGCSFVAIDLSQIELRILAHFSEDPELLRVYQNDEDIHTNTGCYVFGFAPEALPEYPERRSAKVVNFSIAYETTAPGLYEQLRKADVDTWTVQDCQKFIDDWLKLYKGVQNYWKQAHSEARQYGYVRDLFGRIRYIPGVRCKSFWLVSEALRQASNMKVQGTAAAILKRAMAVMPPIYNYYRSQGYVCNPLLAVHDEIILEVQDEILDDAIPVFKALMESAVELKVPTPAEVEVGKTWASLEHYE